MSHGHRHRNNKTALESLSSFSSRGRPFSDYIGEEYSNQDMSLDNSNNKPPRSKKSSTRRSIKDLDKFLSANSSNMDRALPGTLKHYALTKCLAIKRKQVKFLMSRGINAFKLLRVPKIPTAVVYKLVYEITDAENPEDEQKTAKLCKGLNTICAYKMKKMLGYFHKWRIYTHYVKRIDPEIFNPQSVVLDEPEPVLEKPVQVDRLARIKEISAGLAFLQRIYYRRNSAGFTKIVIASKSGAKFDKMCGKCHSVYTIVKYMTGSLRPYFRLWREKTKKTFVHFPYIKAKVRCLDNIATRLTYLSLAKRFYQWRYSLMPPIFAAPPHSISRSYHSENIEDTEEEKIETGNELDIGIFDAEISKSGAQLAQMLRTQHFTGYPAQRVRDAAIKGKIREICIEMMNEIISKYLSYKQQSLNKG